jgi:hypothetical protein
MDAAGVVRADTATVQAGPHPDLTVSAGAIRFGFTAFASGDPLDQPRPALGKVEDNG